MTFKELKFLIYSDLYRYSEKTGILHLLSNLLNNPGFCYTFYMRLCKYLKGGTPKIIFKPLLIVSCRILLHYKYKFGISIPFNTQIGSGLYIGHCGGIVVNEHATIGKNCNLSHDNTLGQANRGQNKGFPRIGDNVYIGPGAKIIGAVNIGNNVAIGANCVVTKDIPDSAVVVGIPGKVISYKGSKDYINRTDY